MARRRVCAIVGVMHFDADYCEHARLRDGREVVLRLIRPDDKELLRRGFLAMSPESRYRRFFTIKHELSDDELRYLTEIDGVRHFALGAVTQIVNYVQFPAISIAITASILSLSRWELPTRTLPSASRSTRP